MIAPTRSITLAVIGCQGLDALHMVRVKVACSLLMADYIQADVQEWKRQPVNVLVANIDDPRGEELVRDAGKKGTTVLAVTRNLVSGLPVPGVPYGASVREIFQQLRQLLLDSDAGDARFKPRTLFRSMEDTAGSACLLNMGLVKLLVDSKRTKVSFLRELPFEKYLQAASESGWTRAVPGDEAMAGYLADVLGECAYEDFCWQAATLSPQVLVPVAENGCYGLHGWPEVKAGKVPSSWLVVMAALLLRQWKPTDLAKATAMPVEDILRILAAAKCTGLLRTATAEPVKAVAKGAGVTAMFSRIANRFGLYFAKKGQG